ncbi:phosphatidate phosphatase LPIN3-like [Panonychus citri]|uniref:phosphatidate phosphatase LPIN3-like n=1 Tax=Panonychus citri TaxID=50023 RepID=UPI002307CE2F|nr:phosphatidate phosphatase LPIN3-like [Panonychus citri]
MDYIGKFISNFKGFYNEINPATLTGAIDVIIVENLDGSYSCSPFHVRFGKMGVLRSRKKNVDIEINGKPVDIQMKLGDSGDAFFVADEDRDEFDDEEDSIVVSNSSVDSLVDNLVGLVVSETNNEDNGNITKENVPVNDGDDKITIQVNQVIDGFNEKDNINLNEQLVIEQLINEQQQQQQQQLVNEQQQQLVNEQPELPKAQSQLVNEQQEIVNEQQLVNNNAEIIVNNNTGDIGCVEFENESILSSEGENFLSGGEEDDRQRRNSRRRFHRKNSATQYTKVLQMTSQQIASLDLRKGRNEAIFSVTTAYQGTARCECSIYLWNHDDKIVVSDIDGTITRSDILGHILPVIGKDWAQSGVANLFNKIVDNGYKILYLSARAIGQAKITREYLKSVRQGDFYLPDGPLLLSPTSLISALRREVIEKKPEEFKIKCLEDIQVLFPTNPFYAGFGNKINDTWAYRAINIPSFRIFTINHLGEVKLVPLYSWNSSYTKLSDLVDQMFPPLQSSQDNKNGDFLSEYSSFNYWRDPLDCPFPEND